MNITSATQAPVLTSNDTLSKLRQLNGRGMKRHPKSHTDGDSKPSPTAWWNAGGKPKDIGPLPAQIVPKMNATSAADTPIKPMPVLSSQSGKGMASDPKPAEIVKSSDSFLGKLPVANTDIMQLLQDRASGDAATS